MDTSSDGAATPKNAIATSPSSDSGRAQKKQPSRQADDFSNMNLDPALGGALSPSGGEISEEAVKANEMWVGNIRVIEALKAWVTRRLENHDYESDKDEAGPSKAAVKEEQEALYPILNSADHE